MIKEGYYRLYLRCEHKITGEVTTRTIRVHRLVADSFKLFKCSSKNQVNHIDGNKHNNSTENLEWISCKENIRHAHQNSLYTYKYGEDNNNASYKNELIVRICNILEYEQSNSKVCDIVGLNKNKKHIKLISDIKCRRTHRNISKNYNW